MQGPAPLTKKSPPANDGADSLNTLSGAIIDSALYVHRKPATLHECMRLGSGSSTSTDGHPKIKCGECGDDSFFTTGYAEITEIL